MVRKQNSVGAIFVDIGLFTMHVAYLALRLRQVHFENTTYLRWKPRSGYDLDLTRGKIKNALWQSITRKLQ